MKKILYLIFAALVATAATSCEPEKKIKAITITVCDAKEEFGEVVADSSDCLEVRRYEYNDKGQIVQELHYRKSYGDCAEDTIQYIYNERNLLAEIISNPIRQELFYDENENVVKSVSKNVVVVYNYDSGQRLTEVRSYDSDTLREVDKFKYHGDTVVCYTYSPDGSELLHEKVSVKCGEGERVLSGEYMSRYEMKIKYRVIWENNVPVETENAYTHVSAKEFFVCESGYQSGKEYSMYKFDDSGEWVQKIDYMEHFDGERSPTSITYRAIEYFQ